MEVFYVTSRDQGDKTFDYAMDHLRIAKLPNVDNKHVTVLRDTSNKQNRQGRNCEDARHRGLSWRFAERLPPQVLHQGCRRAHQPDGIGSQRIWPPLYRVPEPDRRALDAPAIFGDSEPPPTDANRETFKKAATRAAWDGK